MKIAKLGADSADKDKWASSFMLGSEAQEVNERILTANVEAKHNAEAPTFYNENDFFIIWGEIV
jgi:hypothetical protein